jgi:hypothetical protein
LRKAEGSKVSLVENGYLSPGQEDTLSKRIGYVFGAVPRGVMSETALSEKKKRPPRPLKVRMKVDFTA